MGTQLVGTQPPQQPLPTLGPCLLWPNGRPSQQLLRSCAKIFKIIGTEKLEYIRYHAVMTAGLTIFSELELTFTFAICYRPSVCLLSVCLSICHLSVCHLSVTVNDLERRNCLYSALFHRIR